MKKILTLLTSLLVCWYVSLYFATPAHAQEVTLSLNPPVVEVLLAPTKKVSQTFTFHYDGDSLSLIPEIHLAKPIDSSGHVTINPDPIKDTEIPLKITSNHPFNIPFTSTNNTVPITLTFEAASVDVTQDVYLALILRAVPTDPLRQSTLTSPGISALILTTITPDGILPINLEIKDFSPALFHDSWGPLALTPTLANHNAVMIRPEGTYKVIDPFGKTVLTLPLYPSLILGNASRTILGSSADQSSLPLSWSPSWRNLGPYRLQLTITSEGGTQITQVERVIWILPVRLCLIFLFFVFLLSGLVRRKTHTQKDQIDKARNI